MDKEMLIKRFDMLLNYLPEKIKNPLLNLCPEFKAAAQEIRLRAGRPLSITMGSSQFFICKSGTFMLPRADSLHITQGDLEDCFLRLCNHSVYSRSNELCEGYLSLENGHRAGICGKVVTKGEKIETIRDISSINIRIAKEIPHSADSILKEYTGGGILICGGPGTGKTTLLRDLCRQLANGNTGRCKKVAIIDSRGEIAAVSGGVPNADIGITTDVITGANKAKGIEMALRTLFPDVIAFDELGNINEVYAVIQSFNSGVSVITTAHLGGFDDLLKRPLVKALLKTGAIDTVVMCNRDFSFSIKRVSEFERVKSAL